METAGVEPPSLKGAVTSVLTRVINYFKNCSTTFLTTFDKKFVAGAKFSQKIP